MSTRSLNGLAMAILNGLAMATIAGTMLLLGYIGYLMFYPFPTVTVVQPYPVIDKTINPGGLLRYKLDYCRLTDANVVIIHQIRGVVSHRLSGEISFEMVDSGLRLRKGCGIAIKGVTLPGSLPAGEYYLEEQISYKVNPFQTIFHTFRTENFEVINGDTPGTTSSTRGPETETLQGHKGYPDYRSRSES